MPTKKFDNVTLINNPTVVHEITAKISDDGKWVDVSCPRYLSYKISDIPSHRFIWASDNKGYDRFNLDPIVIRRLHEGLGDMLTLDPSLKRWYKKQVRRERIMRRLSISEDAELSHVPNDLTWYGPAGEKKQLRSFQRVDIRLMSMRHILNANQMGAGKTSEVILSLAERELLHGFHLVNAPVAALHDPWTVEIEALYKALGEPEPTILTGDTPSTRKIALGQAVDLYNEGYAFWLLLNPAMVRMQEVMYLDGKPITKKEFEKLDGWSQASVDTVREMLYDELLEIDWTSFIIDEFHLMGLSNRKTQGRMGCEAIKKRTKPARNYVLSGTPMRGKFKKLFGALQYLYPKVFSNEAAWAKSWLNQTHDTIDVNGKEIRINDLGSLKEERQEEFYDYHRKFMIRRTTREALPGMPEKIHVDVWCDMTHRQQEQYNTFALEAEWRIAEVEATLKEKGKRLTATNILTEYTRLRQFADAYCTVSEHPSDEDRLVVEQTTDSGKLVQLMEKMMEEACFDKTDPAPALVFSQFNPMVRMVAGELRRNGLKVEIINGETVAKGLHNDYKARFQAAEISVLVINTMAGTALNLARAESVHLLDETWAPDDQEQAEARAFGGHRAMNKEPGRCYYYRTENTIEQYVMEVCGGKAVNNRMALDLRKKLQTALNVESR